MGVKREMMKEVFDSVDNDKSGTINVSELGSIVQKMSAKPVSAKELAQMLSAVDADGSGEIDFEEFCKLMNSRVADPEEEIKAAFAAFDRDGSGSISTVEVRLSSHSSTSHTHQPRSTLRPEPHLASVSTEHYLISRLSNQGVTPPIDVRRICILSFARRLCRAIGECSPLPAWRGDYCCRGRHARRRG